MFNMVSCVCAFVNHLSLSDAALQLCNLSQHRVLVGQNVVHLLCNLLLVPPGGERKEKKNNNNGAITK